MKGTFRPSIYETYKDCRNFYLDIIKVNSDLIKAIQKSMPFADKETNTLANKVIIENRTQIINIYAGLKEMHRWWIREGKNEKQRLLEKTSSTRGR